MSTHTPGPWKIVQGADECCIYIESSVHGPRGGIATVFCESEKPSDVETADAQLITAAPELFTLLKILAADNWVDLSLTEQATTLKDAAAVIAKVETA